MMKTNLINAVMVGISTVSGVAIAAPPSQNDNGLERRIEYLEQKIAAQDENPALNLLNRITFEGLVEIEAQHVAEEGSAETSDVYVATVELGLAAQVNSWAATEVVFLYEDDGDHSGEVDIDSAFITVSNPDACWFVSAGQYALPFGNFESNMVSDPITLDAAETYDAALQAGIAHSGFFGSLYVFTGDQETEIHNVGANAGFEVESGSFEASISVGWINDLSESDLVVDEATTMTNKAEAWTAFAQMNIGLFSLIGEYVVATETLNAYSVVDEPSFFNVEAAVELNPNSHPVTFAMGLQGSNHGSSYAGGISRSRVLGSTSIEIAEGNSLALEFVRSQDYSGIDADTVTAQFTAEF